MIFLSLNDNLLFLYSKNAGFCILYKLSYFEDNLWGLSSLVFLFKCLVVVCQHISCGNSRDLSEALQGKLLFCIVRICSDVRASERLIYCSCERASQPFARANRMFYFSIKDFDSCSFLMHQWRRKPRLEPGTSGMFYFRIKGFGSCSLLMQQWRCHQGSNLGPPEWQFSALSTKLWGPAVTLPLRL